MSVVKINALHVEPGRGDELAARFASRAGQVDRTDGFEEFQLLRPTDDRTTWLVYTRWRDEEAFQAWTSSRALEQGHARPPGPQGPRATHPQPWAVGCGPHLLRLRHRHRAGRRALRDEARHGPAVLGRGPPRGDLGEADRAHGLPDRRVRRADPALRGRLQRRPRPPSHRCEPGPGGP